MMRSLTLMVVGLLATTTLATKAYDPVIADRAIYYVGATHCSYSSVSTWTCGEACTGRPGTTDVTLIEYSPKDTFAFVAYNVYDNEIVIVFRGTKSTSIENWFTDAEIIRETYKSDVPDASVHHGFKSAYSYIAADVLTAVRSKLSKYPTAKILITGHSLGGALATLAALDIKREINPSNTIHFYTFGCPRVGNKYFADYVFAWFPDGKYSRVVHKDDGVAHQPSSYWGYRHAGNEVWYPADDLTYTECENYAGKSESTACSKS